MLSVDEQDYDVLEYQINTATKFLKDNNQYNKSEELLLKSFKKISKNKNKQKVYFSDVYHEISNINKGNLVTIIDDFILKWLNQKLN
jgi:glutathionylspermidine synthase